MTPWRPSVPGSDEPSQLSVAAMLLRDWLCRWCFRRCRTAVLSKGESPHALPAMAFSRGDPVDLSPVLSAGLPLTGFDVGRDLLRGGGAGDDRADG
jgi:hypothetical protein